MPCAVNKTWLLGCMPAFCPIQLLRDSRLVTLGSRTKRCPEWPMYSVTDMRDAEREEEEGVGMRKDEDVECKDRKCDPDGDQELPREPWLVIDVWCC